MKSNLFSCITVFINLLGRLKSNFVFLHECLFRLSKSGGVYENLQDLQENLMKSVRVKFIEICKFRDFFKNYLNQLFVEKV